MADHNWIKNDVPGNPRNGQYYYVETTATRPTQSGATGKWHIYKDGTKEFLADTTSSVGGAPYVAPAAPVAPVAPAPAASPNGGTAAPNEPPASTATPPVTGIPTPPNDTSIPHPHTTDVAWIPNGDYSFFNSADVKKYVSSAKGHLPLLTNNTEGSPHHGQQYIGMSGATSPTGQMGLWHLYENGDSEFIDKNQGTWDKPYYETNKTQGDPHYGEKYFTITTESPSGKIVDQHVYMDDQGKYDYVTVSDTSSRSGGISSDTSTATITNSPASIQPANRMRAIGPDAGRNQYTVVHGDTLSGIAQANGVPLAEVIAANPSIQDPNLIMPGQEINLPSGQQGAIAPAADSGPTFPTSSTYAAPDPTNQHHLDDATAEKLAGWANVAGEVANDPVKGVIDAAAAHVDTDPTKIDDNKTSNS